MGLKLDDWKVDLMVETLAQLTEILKVVKLGEDQLHE
jgi:hypothetical protein